MKNDMAQQRRRRKKIKRMARQRQQRRMLLLGGILACLVFVLGGTYISLSKTVNQYPENKICKNIYIGSVNVSGMSKKEAKEALKEQDARDREVQIAMTVDKNEAEATLDELGFEYKDTDQVITKAMDYGKKGNFWFRYWKIRRLSKEKLVLKREITLDSKKAGAVLDERVVPMANHAVNATIAKTSGGFEIEKEKTGETVDCEKSMEKLRNYLNQEWKHKAFSISMVTKEEKPSVKESDLESIKDELGTFSTNAGGGERWKNLKTGSEKLNGLVIMPGETVSVHDVTAPYDEEHGYAAAGSYENGQVVETYGGGICQVSTTLYNALLRAEVEIVKRYPHSMLVNYVKPSRDAAIAGDTKDLKFKNNYDTPIYIFGEIDSANELRFTIYGKETREKGREVKYESETTATEEYETVYKADSGLALGEFSYEGSPHTGKTARLWKIVYQDGKEVSRDVINNSEYRKADQIIKVGTKSSNSTASSIVASAVGTQDKGKINAAIDEARSMQ